MEKDVKTLKPIAFEARTLISNERHYLISELEGLTALWALRKVRQYLYLQEVKKLTDHFS